MMTQQPENPFVNPALAATRCELPDPKLAIEPWLDRLADMDEGVHAVGESEWAFDHLVTVAALWRVRPELLSDEETQRLEKWSASAETGMHELLPLAIALPDIDGWIDEAERMDAAWWDPAFPAADQAAWAAQVLRDLDEVDLLLGLARDHQRKYPKARFVEKFARLDRETRAAWAWFLDNLDAFEPASLHVQALGMAMRPEIRPDEVLGEAAEKVVLILEELERTERELHDESDGEREDRAEGGGAVDLLHLAFGTDAEDEDEADDEAAAPLRLADYLPEPPALAAADARVEPADAWELSWRSPDGVFVARAAATSEAGAHAIVVYLFWRPEVDGDGQERFATELTGTVAQLGGCSVRVESSAKAVFPRAEMNAEGPELLICGQRWALDRDP